MNTASSQRVRLLEHLGQVFRERGYEGATLTHLSAATGLGKASLYHHFPGGKAEMAEVLMRDAIAEAERRSFSALRGNDAPEARLQRFVDGFGDYLTHSGGQCLLGVLALGSARAVHGEELAAQFRDWHAALARTLEEAGHKPKRAARGASRILDLLYGSQVVGALLDDPKHQTRALKRLLRSLDLD